MPLTPQKPDVDLLNMRPFDLNKLSDERLRLIHAESGIALKSRSTRSCTCIIECGIDDDMDDCALYGRPHAHPPQRTCDKHPDAPAAD